jgi:hypothetical protein
MRRLLVVGLVAAASLAVAPVAGATDIDWRYGSLGADTKDASPSYSGFRASLAISDCGCHKMDVGAHYPGGWTLYASFVEGYDLVCHSYAGTDTLGALIWNPHSVTQNPVDGSLRYGGNGVPAC